LNAYARVQNAYTEASVLTAPPERLVLMLYDGAIRFLKQGGAAMRQGERVMTRDRLRRAEAIIDELNVTLDMDRGGEISTRLRAIYLFSKRHLIQSMIDMDAQKIDEVVNLLGSLRESWDALAQRAVTAA
jgi:flagellar secretion chaperone FliS